MFGRFCVAVLAPLFVAGCVTTTQDVIEAGGKRLDSRQIAETVGGNDFQTKSKNSEFLMSFSESGALAVESQNGNVFKKEGEWSADDEDRLCIKWPRVRELANYPDFCFEAVQTDEAILLFDHVIHNKRLVLKTP